MANLNEYLQQTDKTEVKNWINSNLANYLKKNTENQGEIEHIIDYLNSPKAPTRLKKMSYDEAKAASEKWVKTMIKKANNIVETEEDVEVVIDFKDGMKFVKLIGENAFKREGKLMSHCVSSYYGKNDVEVYSLRDVKNNPHCTVEVLTSNSSVNQIKGKGNGPIHPNYINYIVKVLKKHFKMDVRDSELKNLGYTYLTDSEWLWLDSNFKKSSISYLTFGGKKYFYNKSRLQEKKTKE